MKTWKNLSLILLLALALAGCRNKSSNLTDFNRSVYTPGYASGFDVKGADGRQSVLLTVTNPWQGAEGVETALFIARDGETAPEGFEGQVLEGDAGRIVCVSSTHIAMLDAIGEAGRVVGVSGIDYISNPDIQARRDSIGDVGYEGNINYELLLSLDPDLVLLFGVNGASSAEGKLKETGIPFLYVGDYLEESPLGKAEWLVALSGNASTSIDMEEAYLLASDADVWLNVGMANTLDELKAACPKFADIRCVRNGFVYNNNARINAAGGNDYWESAVVNPDIVLRDLIKIFHPELVEEPFVYYKQLF